MSLSIDVSFLIIILIGSAAVHVSYSSMNTTFVVNRDNSTFEIVFQPPRECPEKYYLYKARHGEFFLNDGRDVTKESTKLCIKCSQCLDGVEVVMNCRAYHDVVCGSRCIQSGYRFDEGTHSCQHEKVLDEGYNHEELRKWLEEQEKSHYVVSEVGSTSQSTHIETQTVDVTGHQHQGSQKIVGGMTQASTTPTQTSDGSGRLFDEIDSDKDELLEEEQKGENLPRQAVYNHAARLQQLFFIALLFLLCLTISLYVVAGIKRYRPLFFSRIMARQGRLPTPLSIGMSGGRVPRAVTVLASLRSSAHREGSREDTQLPDDGSSFDGSYDGTDDNDDDISDNEESGMLEDGNPKSPLRQDDTNTDGNDDDFSDSEESGMLEEGNPKSPLRHDDTDGNDDDIGDHEESGLLEDGSSKSPLRHDDTDCNDDDISDNEESCLLEDGNPKSPLRKGRNDNKDETSVEKVKPNTQIHHSPTESCDVIGDVVTLHDVDNIKCDDEGSTDGICNPQSRIIDNKLGREDGKNIDHVSKRESTGNEDSFKDENGMSEEVEVQPSSEKETPVIQRDNLSNDGIVSVSKESKNEVIDFDKVWGCEREKRDRSPSDLECLNATDEAGKAKEETKIKDAIEVSSVECVTAINQSQSSGNLMAVDQGIVLRQPLRKAGGLSDNNYETTLEMATPPQEVWSRRRSSSTNANWMSEVHMSSVSWLKERDDKVLHGHGNEKRNSCSSDLNAITLNVHDESDSDQTNKEMKGKEDTTGSVVEGASIINSPGSPGTLEAGGDQGVPVSNAGRILLTTECETSHETGIHPHAMTRRRSSSYTNIISTNKETLKSHSTPGDLNQIERNTSDTIIYQHGRQAESQSLPMKDTNFCRDNAKDKIHRFGSDEAKKEMKTNDIKVSIDVLTRDRKTMVDILHQGGQVDCESVPTINALQSPRNLGCEQGVGVNIRGCNAQRLYTVECETLHEAGNIPQAFSRRRRNSTYANWMSGTDRRYTPPSTRSRVEEISVPVMNDANRRSKIRLARRPLSEPSMPHFDEISIPVMNDANRRSKIRLARRPLSEPVIPHFDEISVPVMNDANRRSKMRLAGRPLSEPAMPHFDDISIPVMNDANRRSKIRLARRPLSESAMPHFDEISIPVMNDANRRSKMRLPRIMRLTLNPLLASLGQTKIWLRPKDGTNDEVPTGRQVECQPLLMTDAQFCRLKKTKSKMHRFGSNALENTI